MQRLINSLLDINRLEAGQSITNQQAVNAGKMVNEAIEIVQPVLENKQIQVSVQLPAIFPFLWVDEDMIRRVLINLLENAIKYTPVRGEITVAGEVEGDWVKLSIKDNGPGIPRDAREHIFDKFIRLQSDRFPRGVGLGLAFCRLAVQAHGGQIWVESQEGAGSRFLFTIPAARAV
jgi:two-component system, NtrC family, sensor histidine kinase KinB